MKMKKEKKKQKTEGLMIKMAEGLLIMYWLCQSVPWDWDPCGRVEGLWVRIYDVDI